MSSFAFSFQCFSKGHIFQGLSGKVQYTIVCKKDWVPFFTILYSDYVFVGKASWVPALQSTHQNLY